MEFVGCFWDDVDNRDFIESTKLVDRIGMTREMCKRHCWENFGHQFIGLQVSDSIQPCTHSSTSCNKKTCNSETSTETEYSPSAQI